MSPTPSPFVAPQPEPQSPVAARPSSLPTAGKVASATIPTSELQRRLTEILDLIDGREDADHDGNGFRPNIFMRIGMIARGEDRP